jgi:hypothetical protein
VVSILGGRTHSIPILEKILGMDHPEMVASFNNLAEVNRIEIRYNEAEPVYKRSLAIV